MSLFVNNKAIQKLRKNIWITKKKRHEKETPLKGKKKALTREKKSYPYFQNLHQSNLVDFLEIKLYAQICRGTRPDTISLLTLT